jgi:hypothetical protein
MLGKDLQGPLGGKMHSYVLQNVQRGRFDFSQLVGAQYVQVKL